MSISFIVTLYIFVKGGWDSVVGIDTGWMVRESNPGGGRDFHQPSRPALGPNQPPIQWVFPGGKVAEAW
jgi:8-oxo-dGTP pyrophosphatase MutT (NUDIX family)